MPCFATGSREGDLALSLDQARSESTRATQLLCRTLTALEPSVVATLPQEIQTWWAEHQEIDRKRVEREQRLAKAQEAQERRTYERLQKKFGDA